MSIEEESKEIIERHEVINQGIDFAGLSDPKTFREAERLLNAILPMNEFTAENSFSDDSKSRPTFSLKAYINQTKNIVNELKRDGKALDFILGQSILHILNPTLGQGKIYNPLSVFGPLPFLGGFQTNSLDVPISYMNPGSDIARREDVLVQLYNGNKTSIDVVGGIPPLEVKGPDVRLSDGLTLEEKMKQLNIATPEDPFSNFEIFNDQNQNVIFSDNLSPGTIQRTPDFEKLFSKNNRGPAFGEAEQGALFFRPNAGAKLGVTTTTNQMANAQRNIDSYFDINDALDGYVSSKLQETLTVVPFYFQDLRKPDRYLYFRAFLNSVMESFQPDWNQEKFYGRIDPVPTYMNTSRVFNISFKIVAMSQYGLGAMWKKVNNFCKMLYPTFKDGVLFAAPMVRLKLGDLISDGDGNGLPGFILSPELNYSESTWEIIDYSNDGSTELGRVPMSADITFSFQVVHEKSPHIDENYNFDFSNFRKMGTPPDVTEEESDQITDVLSRGL